MQIVATYVMKVYHFENTNLQFKYKVIAHSHLARLPQGLTAYGIYGDDIKIARLVCLRHLYSHSIRQPSGNLITVL